MKKAFVWDPQMRSSALKYDPCILRTKKGKTKTLCEDCTITLIADRFLGEEFQGEVLGKLGMARGRFPYVIIADTLGCNLRCWFCYAYKFFDKKTAEENKCTISYVSPERLAEQFGCKLEKLSDFEAFVKAAKEKELKESERKKAVKHLQLKLPLMRLRISGGEPVFSTKETITESCSDEIVGETVNYWLIFFRTLDKIVGRLKKEGKLQIIDKSEIEKKSSKSLIFPTCIANRPNRLNIRFDTNGILFRNTETTDAFIGGLFEIHRNSDLNNIFVEIDYSLKGATPVEYDWSQRRNLPVDPSKIDFGYKLEEHPQLPGYLELTRLIENYKQKDRNFNNCVGITVERGINHHIPKRVFLNCERSLNWDMFSEKSGIEFSVVNNPIEMFNWYNGRPKTFFIQNGANMKIVCNQEVFNLQEHPDISQFDKFRREHRSNCHFIIYPAEKKVDLIVASKKRRKEMLPFQTTLFDLESRGWIFSGNAQNWKTAIQNNKWGVKEGSREIWKRIKEDDYALFYVTRPVSRIIGFAKIRNLGEESSLLWPDEIVEGKVKYPLRICFEETVILPEEEWNNGLKPYGLEIRHGLNPINDKDRLHGVTTSLTNLIEEFNRP